MDAPFLTGQLVRVVRVRHEILRGEIGAIEQVTRCAGKIIWCRPMGRVSDGTYQATHNRHIEVARGEDELEALTCG